MALSPFKSSSQYAQDNLITDFGFGLFDRKSILVVLLVLVLSGAIFGFPLPIDIFTVYTIIVGIILFSGALYACMIVGRVLLALMITTIEVVVALLMIPLLMLMGRNAKSAEDTSKLKTALEECETLFSRIVR